MEWGACCGADGGASHGQARPLGGVASSCWRCRGPRLGFPRRFSAQGCRGEKSLPETAAGGVAQEERDQGVDGVESQLLP